MNKRNFARLNMFNVVDSVFNDEVQALSILPGFPENSANFRDSLNSIKQSLIVEPLEGSGAYEMKNEKRETLVNSSNETAVKLKAFAKYYNNYPLLYAMSFNNTSLSRLSAPKLVSVARTIHHCGTENISQMEGFNLSQRNLSELLQHIDEFEKATPITALKRITRSLNLSELNTCFETADTSLSKIDTVIEIIKFSNPTLYTRYKKARRILAISTRYITLKGNVTDSTGEKALSGASITFVELDAEGNPADETTTLTKSTADKGGFVVKSLDNGTYRVTVTKIGYKDLTLTIHVDDENDDLILKMETI